MSCQDKALRVHLRDESFLYMADVARPITSTYFKKWSHFAFTWTSGSVKRLAVFFDGVKLSGSTVSVISLSAKE